MSISTLRQKLTPDDITQFVRGQTEQVRAVAAQKLCKRIDSAQLQAGDRERAEEILTIMVADAAELVRRTLAVTLRNSPRLPRSVAMSLASDIESIATPILKYSPSLTDDDLVEIIKASEAEKQTAIAEREHLSTPVTSAMSEHGAQQAATVMAANDGADISPSSFDVLLGRFEGDEALHRAIISRSNMPIGVAEKLVTQISGEMFRRLVTRHELPPQLAIEISESARERAVIDLIDQIGFTSDPSRFAQQLNMNARLTPSLVMRALCMGHIRFVEFALSELTGLAHGRIWRLLHDRGAGGLEAVFERAGLPAGLLAGFRLAVEVHHETEMDGRRGDRERFRKRMIERVLTAFQAISRKDVDYLLDKLDALDQQVSDIAQAA